MCRNYPERAVHAGALYAMGLIDEASHVVMARYRETLDPKVMPTPCPGSPGTSDRMPWTRCC